MFCKLLHISFVVNYHFLSLPKYACNIKYLNVCMHACKPCQPWYLFFGCLMSFVLKNCWLQVSSCRLGLKLVLGCLIMSLVLENCWLVANSCRLGLKLVFWLPLCRLYGKLLAGYLRHRATNHATIFMHKRQFSNPNDICGKFCRKCWSISLILVTSKITFNNWMFNKWHSCNFRLWHISFVLWSPVGL